MFYVFIEMIVVVMGGKLFCWFVGIYVFNGKFDYIMMVWEIFIIKDGCYLKEVKGMFEEEVVLEKSYVYFCVLCDEVIVMGVFFLVFEWNKLNFYIK